MKIFLCFFKFKTPNSLKAVLEQYFYFKTQNLIYYCQYYFYIVQFIQNSITNFKLFKYIKYHIYRFLFYNKNLNILYVL